MNLFELAPERYYSWPATYDQKRREDRLATMISSGNYLWSLKTDGNYGRFVVQDGIKKLQTRGISKKTNTYGEVQDKVLFFDKLANAFDRDTVIIGEIFLEGKIDKDVGAILRCLPEKALARQKEQSLKFRIFDIWYYDGLSLMEQPIEIRCGYISKALQKINSPDIIGVKYYELDGGFFDHLGRIFELGGEGVVIYDKSGKPSPGSRTAWKTLKIKQELQAEIDCFIYGIEPANKLYTGKHIETHPYWFDPKNLRFLQGEYYDEYIKGELNLEPVSKGHFYGWPGAIYCAAYDENYSPVIICKVAGLNEELKEELKNNYEKYHLMPIKITGMMLSTDKSVRHPKLVSLRDNDISADDCTLDKIF